MGVDYNGEFLNVIIGAAVGGVISAATTAFSSYKETGHIDACQTLIAGITGAVCGGVAATGLGVFVQAGISAAASGAGSLASDIYSAKKNGHALNIGRTAAKVGLAAVTGFGCSLLGSGAGKLLTKDLEQSGRILQVKGRNMTHSYTRAQAKELSRQGKNLVNTAHGINSVVGTIFTWPYSCAANIILGRL